MRTWLVLTAAAVLTCCAESALAHKLGCFAGVEGEKVAGYAWLGGGARAANAPFRVLAPDGAVLHEGRTNDEGEFFFVPARVCDHRIIVEAGEGHVARFTVPAEELRTVSAGSVAGAEEIAAIVDRSVSRRIAPLRRELAELKQKRRLQDILAGLGYIAGITGIVFYFLGRRRENS